MDFGLQKFIIILIRAFTNVANMLNCKSTRNIGISNVYCSFLIVHLVTVLSWERLVFRASSTIYSSDWQRGEFRNRQFGLLRVQQLFKLFLIYCASKNLRNNVALGKYTLLKKRGRSITICEKKLRFSLKYPLHSYMWKT